MITVEIKVKDTNRCGYQEDFRSIIAASEHNEKERYPKFSEITDLVDKLEKDIYVAREKRKES